MIKILALFLLLFAPATVADSVDFVGLQSLGDTRYQLFASPALGHSLHIYIRIPPVDANNPDRKFPTVYLLDGGVNFPLLSSYLHLLRFGDEVPQMILVGISYGSDTFEEGNFRSSDFTAPSQEREWWGKASTFQAVLATELIPMIESGYPSNPARRIIFGQSLGGQFVLYCALTQPQLFWGHIASNPALHRNLDHFLRWQGTTEMPLDATRLFVAEGEFDDSRYKVPAMEWIQYWSQPDRQKPFVLEFQQLPGQTHLSAVPEAFRRGLQWLLGSGPSAEQQ